MNLYPVNGSCVNGNERSSSQQSVDKKMTDNSLDVSSVAVSINENSNLENGEEKYSDDRPPKHFLLPFQKRNPSLIMRMRDFEFETSKECVSSGRGYLNTGIGKDRTSIEVKTFVRGSKNWNDDVLKLCQCSLCGLITLESMTDGSRTYCSEECALEAATRESNFVETSIFDLFSAGETGTAEIGKEVVDGRAPCRVVLDGQTSLYEQMHISKEQQKLLNPKKGDDVLVEDEKKGFVRGVVLEADPLSYKVALIDYSEIVYVKEVYAMSNELRSVISFGGVISFIGNETPQSKLVKFRVRERSSLGVWVCDVFESDANDVTEIVLEEWIPPFRIKFVPLQSGCSVVITQYVDAREMYVRRIDNPWNEEYIRFNNDIAAYCVEGKKYKKIPNIGEICCVRYEKDGCFYRGVVRGTKDNLAVVSFMDVGTEQATDVSDLRYLPALAKQVPAFCTLIKLKGVTLSSSPGSIIYLNRLTGYGCELVLSCLEDLDNEAVLTDKFSGEIVNEVIRSFEIPSWVKNRHAFVKTGEVFTLSTIQEITFKCGEVQDIVLLHFDEHSFKKNGLFWCTIHREDYLGHLHGELREKMTEYCSHLQNDRYLPRRGELCIAKLRGEWRRAMCLGDKDVICKLTFIDHGETTWVETKNVRKIIKEFLEMPALAVKCVISDKQKMSGREKEDLITYMNIMNRKVMPGVKVVSRSQEIYHLSINIPPNFDLTRPVSPAGSSSSGKEDIDEDSAVVTISLGNFDDDEMIDAVTSCIDFQSLEMDLPKFRKLNNGVLTMEVFGGNCREDAKLLVEELNSVFCHRDARVCYLTRGKLKVSGIPDFVTKDQLIEKLAEVGRCDRSEIRVTTFIHSIRPKVAWVKSPLRAALDIAEKGTLAWESSAAEVEIQQRRPLRCFRCLREGHIGAQCSSEVGESRCFRCSQIGHLAAQCTRQPHCDFCAEKGFPAAHRIGSSSCKSRNLPETKINK